MFKCDQFSWSSQSSLWFKPLSFLIGPRQKVKFFYSFAKTYLYHENLINVHPDPKFTFRIQETFLTGPNSILWFCLSPPLPLKLPFILQSKIGLQLSPVHFFSFLPSPHFSFPRIEFLSYLLPHSSWPRREAGTSYLLRAVESRDWACVAQLLLSPVFFGDLLLCSSHASAQLSPLKHWAVNIWFRPAVLGCFIIIHGF